MKRFIPILAFILLVSCTQKDIKGIVTTKKYKKGHLHMYFVSVSNGKGRTMRPRYMYIPDKYSVSIVDSTTHEISLEKKDYELVNIGDSLFRLDGIITFKH